LHRPKTSIRMGRPALGQHGSDSNSARPAEAHAPQPEALPNRSKPAPPIRQHRVPTPLNRAGRARARPQTNQSKTRRHRGRRRRRKPGAIRDDLLPSVNFKTSSCTRSCGRCARPSGREVHRNNDPHAYISQGHVLRVGPGRGKTIGALPQGRGSKAKAECRGFASGGTVVQNIWPAQRLRKLESASRTEDAGEKFRHLPRPRKGGEVAHSDVIQPTCKRRSARQLQEAKTGLLTPAWTSAVFSQQISRPF